MTENGMKHRKCITYRDKFELNLSRNLWELIEQMEDKMYRIGGYHKFMIYDPKEREIQALSFRDRVVQHCLCDNILVPYFEKRLIYDNAACRVGKGTHFAMGRLSFFLHNHYKSHGTKGYILKYDIRHYFDSIDHDVLKERLKKIPDRNVLGLLYHIINSYAKEKNSITQEEKGLPMGNQTSQWFALYYLDPMDRLIKEKTQIFPISEGVDFLGFRFYLTDTGKVIKRLRTANKKRWKRRLKKFQEEYRNETKTLEDIRRSIISYSGHLSHGHTYKLKKKVMANFVLTKTVKRGGLL